MTPRRVGFSLLVAGHPVGVVVHDERPRCSGAACRCGAAVYDVSFPLAAAWLRGHVAGEHGATHLGVDSRSVDFRRPREVTIFRQLLSLLGVAEADRVA